MGDISIYSRAEASQKTKIKNTPISRDRGKMAGHKSYN